MMEHERVNEGRIIESIKVFWLKLPIVLQVLPVVIIVSIFKFISHIYGFEIMELNYLFPSLVAGVVFLMGFLILGVFADYKESERKMSELSSTLRSLWDDVYTIYKYKHSETAREFVSFQVSFLISLVYWLYAKKKEWVMKTKSIMDEIRSMNKFFGQFEKEGIPTEYIIKMKNKQDALRDIILRMDTIRRTKFVAPAYAIVILMCIGVAFGLIITEIQAFYISFFFTITITFFIFFMLFLIKDLENPFEYYIKGVKGEKYGTEISLDFVREFREDILKLIEESIEKDGDTKLKELIKELIEKSNKEFKELIKNDPKLNIDFIKELIEKLRKIVTIRDV